MDIYAAFALFGVTIILYWVITEMFAILFRFTGLPDEKARFQVISLLTGCGFTTRESEMFISSRSRRRLARATMLFGYVFNITFLSSFINVFFSMRLTQVEHYFLGPLFPLVAVSLIMISMRVPAVRSWMDDKLFRLAERVFRQGTENSVLLMDYIGRDIIAQVNLHEVPEDLQNKPLSETGLKPDHNILVMLVDRGGAQAEPAAADTVFRPGDKLTVFGDYQTICRVFHARERFNDED